MRSVQLAIDIGTKFTTITQKEKGFMTKDASLVFISNRHNKIELIEVGRGVSSYIGQTRSNEQVISPIKEGAIYHERAAVLMYRAFLNKIVGESFFRPKIKAIACVSCGLTNSEKKDIEKVLLAAGISEVIILESPLAAYATIDDGTAQCMVDIGASKTEIAIVNRDGIVAGCSVNIGGNTINQAIMDCLLDEQGIKLAVERVEIIKKQLATLGEQENFVVNEIVTRIGSNEQIAVQIHSSTVKKAIQPLIQKINTAIFSMLSQVPQDILDQISTNGIFLYGGTSRIDGICDFMSNDLGLPVTRSENPENIVAQGGLYYIDHKERLANLLNVVNLK